MKPAKKPKTEPKVRAVYCANPACFTALRRLPLKEGSSHTVVAKRDKKTYHFCSQFCRDQVGANLEKIPDLSQVAAQKRRDAGLDTPEKKEKPADDEEDTPAKKPSGEEE